MGNIIKASKADKAELERQLKAQNLVIGEPKLVDNKFNGDAGANTMASAQLKQTYLNDYQIQCLTKGLSCSNIYTLPIQEVVSGSFGDTSPKYLNILHHDFHNLGTYFQFIHVQDQEEPTLLREYCVFDEVPQKKVEHPILLSELEFNMFTGTIKYKGKEDIELNWEIIIKDDKKGGDNTIAQGQFWFQFLKLGQREIKRAKTVSIRSVPLPQDVTTKQASEEKSDEQPVGAISLAQESNPAEAQKTSESADTEVQDIEQNKQQEETKQETNTPEVQVTFQDSAECKRDFESDPEPSESSLVEEVVEEEPVPVEETDSDKETSAEKRQRILARLKRQGKLGGILSMKTN